MSYVPTKHVQAGNTPGQPHPLDERVKVCNCGAPKLRDLPRKAEPVEALSYCIFGSCPPVTA